MSSHPTHHPGEDGLLAFATGAADAPLRLMLELHLARCPRCAGAVAELATPGAALLRSMPEPVQPPVPELFDRIWDRVSAQKIEAAPEIPLPPGVLAELPSPKDWEWHGVLSKGGRFARLLEDRSGSALFMVDLPPGAVFPEHTHPGQEEFMILTGAARDGDVLLDVGDWRTLDAGSHHEPVADPKEGCWLISRVEGGDIRLHGWRGALQRAYESLSRLRGKD